MSKGRSTANTRPAHKHISISAPQAFQKPFANFHLESGSSHWLSDLNSIPAALSQVGLALANASKSLSALFANQSDVHLAPKWRATPQIGPTGSTSTQGLMRSLRGSKKIRATWRQRFDDFFLLADPRALFRDRDAMGMSDRLRWVSALSPFLSIKPGH